MNAATGSACCSSTAAKGGSSLLTLLGVLMIIVGMLAIAAPMAAGEWAVWAIGILLGVAGVLRLLSAFHATSWGGGALRLLWGALTTVCAALVITNPIAGVFTLTLILAIYFVIQGIAEIIMSLRMKPLAGWGWVLFNGIIALVLGLIIWSEWPLSGVWAIGTLLGINILFTGWCLIAARPRACC